VFDVQLNSQHTVVKNLDIFSIVGKAMAHDEYIPFTINDGMLEVQGESSPFGGKLKIDFVKVKSVNCSYLAHILNTQANTFFCSVNKMQCRKDMALHVYIKTKSQCLGSGDIMPWQVSRILGRWERKTGTETTNRKLPDGSHYIINCANYIR